MKTASIMPRCKSFLAWAITSKLSRGRVPTIASRHERDDFKCWVTAVSAFLGANGWGFIDGPSLDHSYFSRLQPISLLFLDPSSSHIAELRARTRYLISMLHTHPTPAGEAAEICRPVDVESFRSQHCRWRSRLHSKRCWRVVKPFLTQFSSLGSFLFLDKIPAWRFFGKPFNGTRQYCSCGHLFHIIMFTHPFLVTYNSSQSPLVSRHSETTQLLFSRLVFSMLLHVIVLRNNGAKVLSGKNCMFIMCICCSENSW